MSGKAKLLLAVIAIAAGVVAALFVFARDNRPDKEQINAALDESIAASKEGRAGGVLDLMSDQFEVSGIGKINRNWLAARIRENKPDVAFTNETLEINGDQAEMTADASLRLKISLGPVSRDLSPSLKGVKLVFRKEDARKFIFVPARVWKLAEVKLPPGSPLDLGF